jgi:hypothetical protein
MEAPSLEELICRSINRLYPSPHSKRANGICGVNKRSRYDGSPTFLGQISASILLEEIVAGSDSGQPN